MDWLQGDRAGANLIGQCGKAEVNSFPCITFGLPVQRLVLPELLEQDHRQQVRPRPSARGRVEGCRRLTDLLAIAAGELLPHGLDHLPLARDHLKRLRHVFAHLHDAGRTAAGAGGGRFDH